MINYEKTHRQRSRFGHRLSCLAVALDRISCTICSYMKTLTIPKRGPSDLDKHLAKSLAEVKQGKIYGPFDNVADLMSSLQRFKKSR